MMIKGSIQEEDIILINIYDPIWPISKYIKQLLTNINGEIDNNTRRLSHPTDING